MTLFSVVVTRLQRTIFWSGCEDSTNFVLKFGSLVVHKQSMYLIADFLKIAQAEILSAVSRVNLVKHVLHNKSSGGAGHRREQ